MKHTPQRPFVPTGGSRAKPESSGGAAFRVAPPFVHGARPVTSAPAPRMPVEAPPPPPAPRSAPPPLPLVYEPPADTPPRAQTAAESLAPIQQFLHAESPAQPEPPGIDEYAYELPPVEHFMDAETENVSAATAGRGAATEIPGSAQSDDVDTSEWSEADWQQFDWRAAAALGEVADPEANNAWSETDWEKVPRSSRDVRESAANAIADALDGIARRIREGDLFPPSPGSLSSPSDIAAALAALLKVKR